MNEAKQSLPAAQITPDSSEQDTRPAWRTPEITKVSLRQTFGNGSNIPT